MTSRRTYTLGPEGLLAAWSIACLLVVGGGVLVAAAAAGGDWVTYTDETDTRLSSDPSVGSSDVREKDLATGDVDQDGDTDLIVVRKIPFTNAGGFRNVLFMNQEGVMTDLTATLAPDFLDLTDDRDVELADVDGDGWLDIITAGTFHEQPRILMNLGEAGGIWQGFSYDLNRLPHLETPQGNGPFFCGLGVGDVTGNGRPDLYFTDYGSQAGLPGDADLEDRLLINDGSGFFTDQTEARLTPQMADSTFGTDADVADMNGDGFNDIIKNNSSGTGGFSDSPLGVNPAVAILYNDGTGNFVFMDNVYTAAPYMVEPVDFTQDGRLDLIVVDDGQDSYMINTGNDGSGHAQFTTHSVLGPNTQFFGGNLTIADLDNDGVLDAMIADVDTDIPGCSRQLVLLQGQGTPPAISFADPLSGGSRPWTPQGVHDVQAFHINDDETLDLWISTCTGTLIFMGVGDGLFADGFESGSTSAWSSTVP